MKNIQGIIYTLLAAILLFGCEEVEREPVLRPGDAPSLTQPQAGTQLVFDRDNATVKQSNLPGLKPNMGFPVPLPIPFKPMLQEIILPIRWNFLLLTAYRQL
jgi:hypothetical protein